MDNVAERIRSLNDEACHLLARSRRCPVGCTAGLQLESASYAEFAASLESDLAQGIDAAWEVEE